MRVRILMAAKSLRELARLVNPGNKRIIRILLFHFIAMKHLITCLALGIACTAGAQGTTIQEYPWNPDWNNDNYIGSSDLTGFLAAFGSEFGNPPEPCDYDGTGTEELIIASIYEEGYNGLVMDSIFVEYTFQNTDTYFLPGCPDPVTDTILYSNAVMMNTWTHGNAPGGFGPNSSILIGYPSYGPGHVRFAFVFDIYSGTYNVWFEENILNSLGYSQAFPGNPIQVETTIPFNDQIVLDENGLIFCCPQAYVIEITVIPYWHYAE